MHTHIPRNFFDKEMFRDTLRLICLANQNIKLPGVTMYVSRPFVKFGEPVSASWMMEPSQTPVSSGLSPLRDNL